MGSDDTRPAWELPDTVVRTLLDDERCRTALEVLAAADRPMTVHDLARAVAGRERDEDPDRVSYGVAMRVYDDLHDQHLPRLTATAIVEYDPKHATVSLVDETVRESLGH